MADETLLNHYVDTIQLIEQLVLRRAPWPFNKAVGLTPTEREQVALRLVQALEVAVDARLVAAGGGAA